jgi:hypothetical protein
VELVLSILTPEGEETSGATSAARDLVTIGSRYTEDKRRRSVNHELWHVLGGVEHVGNGVAGGKGHGDTIDADALTAVCAATPCAAFNPEGY